MNFLNPQHQKCELGSSISIVTGSGLGDQHSVPNRGGGFFLYPLCSADSGAHPASYTVGTGGSYPRGKARPGRDADHSPTSSAEFKKERGYTSPPSTFAGV
jgi:hypothetical protein